MDWNNQYCKNDYRIHKNIQIQYIPFQIIKDIFHRIGIKQFYNLYGNTKAFEYPKKF